MRRELSGRATVINALPFSFVPPVANAAKAAGVHYFSDGRSLARKRRAPVRQESVSLAKYYA